MDLLELMLKPFITCLILTGIHAYLGLHVIQRGVIFVDLALAQTAALGATFGFLLGFGLHSTQSYFCSLLLTSIAAGVFALLRSDDSEVPQEAYIGIVYAISAAASILVLSYAPEGGEELKSLMVGHLLFVDWYEVIYILIIYSVIGLLHYRFRTPLLQISKDSKEASRQGINVRHWDFFFYLTFGIVVTSSVEIAGVLLVFSFLVVPAVCGVILGHGIRGRLLVGLVCGGITSMIGVSTSFYMDLPTGATIVCAFGVTLVSVLLIRTL